MSTLPQLVTALEDAAQRARDLSRPLGDLGGSIIKAAVPRAPRGRTGDLATSVRARTSAGLLEFTSTVRYFAPVHNGRKRRGSVRARPWVAETIKASELQVTTALGDHVLEPLERL